MPYARTALCRFLVGACLKLDNARSSGGGRAGRMRGRLLGPFLGLDTSASQGTKFCSHLFLLSPPPPPLSPDSSVPFAFTSGTAREVHPSSSALLEGVFLVGLFSSTWTLCRLAFRCVPTLRVRALRGEGPEGGPARRAGDAQVPLGGVLRRGLVPRSGAALPFSSPVRERGLVSYFLPSCVVCVCCVRCVPCPSRPPRNVPARPTDRRAADALIRGERVVL